MNGNGQRPVVIFDADKVNVDESSHIARVVPAWILSCCINASIIAAFFLLTAPEAVTADLQEATMMSIPETTVQPPNLEVDDIGVGGMEITYDSKIIAEVSIPGLDRPMDPVGAAGDVNNLFRSLPPPPGLGSTGNGVGQLGPGPGRAGLEGADGGYAMGRFRELGNLGARGSAATKYRALINNGGNPASEAAVARGIKWLINHQATDGHVSLQDFRQHGRCNCTGAGKANSDVAGTSFFLLPLLGGGQTHKPGSTTGQLYTKQVEKALAWLVLKQNRDGSFEPNSHHEMYSHGLATIALCEAYALTSDVALREPAQRALTYICTAQTPEGGWRYQGRGNQRGYDGSIGAWELMALKSGQMAGLDVPAETLTRASKWLDTAASPDGSRYGYQEPHPADGLRPATTSAGLLCRMYLGWGQRSPGLLTGVQYLRAHKPRVNDMYYSYYATQVMHHMGGQYWAEWNPVMRDGLLEAQDKGDKVPHQAGSWYDPTDHISTGHGGRVMQTSLSLVTLEVYYRHLPLYRREVGANKDVVGR
ncbi:MAG: prenyltransferase/squalene oxidase repeat-containing protein [Gemmataceae bacterium]